MECAPAPPDGSWAAQSLYWRNLFRERAATPAPLPWGDTYRLTPSEASAIGPSLQQFQLGEGSEGRGFLRRAQQHACSVGDPLFPQALHLFILEEQRHSRDLGRFLQAQGIPLLSHHWLDAWFRRVRRLAGLFLMVAVLSVAEVIAVPYYEALRQATGSPLLRALCEVILADEALHLRYQATTLARLPHRWRRLYQRGQRFLLAGTVLLVWKEHRSVFRRGGYTRGTFTKQCYTILATLHAEVEKQAEERSQTTLPGISQEPVVL